MGVQVHGRVQGVGFRAWTVREAGRRGLAGWVRNRRDGSVEAVFSGPHPDVDDMVALCRAGPRLALVSEVRTGPAPEVPAASGFFQKPDG